MDLSYNGFMSSSPFPVFVHVKQLITLIQTVATTSFILNGLIAHKLYCSLGRTLVRMIKCKDLQELGSCNLDQLCLNL